MANRFTLADIFSNAEFQSGSIERKELESLLKDAVDKLHPDESIKKFKYGKNGVEIILESGDKIQVDIDWNEISLS